MNDCEYLFELEIVHHPCTILPVPSLCSSDGPPVTNRVDGAAEVLGVHVRRIYELIKILEILSLVTVRLLQQCVFTEIATCQL